MKNNELFRTVNYNNRPKMNKTRKQNGGYKIANNVDKNGIKHIFKMDDVFNHEEVYKKIEDKMYLQGMHMRPHKQTRDRIYENDIIKKLIDALDKYGIKMYLGLQNDYQYNAQDNIQRYQGHHEPRIIIYTNKNVVVNIYALKRDRGKDAIIQIYVYDNISKIFHDFKKIYGIRYVEVEHEDLSHSIVGIEDVIQDFIHPHIYADYINLLDESDITKIVEDVNNCYEKEDMIKIVEEENLRLKQELIHLKNEKQNVKNIIDGIKNKKTFKKSLIPKRKR
jgi:hypothetical protein